MNVTEAQRRRHEASDDSAQTHRSKPPTAEDLHRQAETRQRAHAEGASSSDLARKTQSGASWRKRLEQDIVSHLPDTAKQIVRRAVIGYGGDKLYARGCDVAKQIKHLPEEQLKDILGMVNAGTRFGKAMAHEQAELKRPVAYVAPKSLKAQAESPVAKARGLAKRAATERAKIANAWRRLSHLTRGAELSVGVTKGLLLVPQAAKEGIATTEERSLEPLQRFAHEVHVTGQYLSGHVTQLQRKTDAAYVKVVASLSEIQAAYDEMATALSTSPPDTLAADAAQKRALAAAGTVDKQATDFRNLASEYAAAIKEFDHQVVHTALEVLLSAAAAGLGLALGGGSGAAHGAGEMSKLARAAHVATEVAEHVALDGKVGREVDKALDAVHQVHDAAKRVLE